MGNFIISGIDVHDNNFVFRTGLNKEDTEKRVFRNNREGRAESILYLKEKAKAAGGATIVVAYEASALGFGICDEYQANEITCHVLAPTKIPRTTQDRKKKNDDRDAAKIQEVVRGHLLAGNKLPAVWVPDIQTRDDREVVRTRLDLSQKLTELKSQVRMLVKRNGIEKPSSTGEAWGRKYRHWLLELSQADGAMKSGAQYALSSLLRQITAVEGEIAAADLAVKQLSLTARYSVAATALQEQIKGVATLTAMVFLTEMGDLHRFKNRKQIGAYLGLAPSCHESGNTDDRKGHITHEGPARVRKVLCQATWSRVAHDKKEAAFYARLVAKNPKHRKIAVVASMRRVGILMWHIAKAAMAKGVVASGSGAGKTGPALPTKGRGRGKRLAEAPSPRRKGGGR